MSKTKSKTKSQPILTLAGVEPFDMSDVKEFDINEAKGIDPSDLNDGFELLKEAGVLPNP